MFFLPFISLFYLIFTYFYSSWLVVHVVKKYYRINSPAIYSLNQMLWAINVQNFNIYFRGNALTYCWIIILSRIILERAEYWSKYVLFYILVNLFKSNFLCCHLDFKNVYIKLLIEDFNKESYICWAFMEVYLMIHISSLWLYGNLYLNTFIDYFVSNICKKIKQRSDFASRINSLDCHFKLSNTSEGGRNRF